VEEKLGSNHQLESRAHEWVVTGDGGKKEMLFHQNNMPGYGVENP
jgi:hypothetical protein